MIKKKVKYVFLLFLLLGLAPILANGGVSHNGFQVYLEDGASIGFQNQLGKHLVLEVTSGVLNSTDNNLILLGEQGSFRFNSSSNLGFKIIIPTNDMYVRVRRNDVLLGFSNNSVLTANQYDDVLINWGFLVQPWFPVMFAFGIGGLILMVAGPSYGMFKIKKKEYHSGLVWGTIYTTIGVALVLGWLWS